VNTALRAAWRAAAAAAPPSGEEEGEDMSRSMAGRLGSLLYVKLIEYMLIDHAIPGETKITFNASGRKIEERSD
jgi:hypothetical protein